MDASILLQNISVKFQSSHPNQRNWLAGAPNTGGIEKIGDFRPATNSIKAYMI